MKRRRSEGLSTQSDKRKKISKEGKFVALRKDEDKQCAHFTTAVELNVYWLTVSAGFFNDLQKLYIDKGNRLNSGRTVEGINKRINFLWDQLELRMERVKLCAWRLGVQNPIEKTPFQFRRAPRTS